MSNQAPMICFMLALNASKSDAESVIDRISDLFKLDGDAIPAAQATSIGPTAPAAPANPIPAAGSTGGGIDLDSENLPWDERIHSSTRNKNEDGTWRIKRGTDKSYVTKIKNQLRATVPAAAATPAAAPAQASLPSIPALPQVPGLPPIPGAAPVNPAFTEFVQFITANSPPFTPEYVKSGLVAFNVPEGDIQNLAHMPDAIPSIRAAFAAAIGK